MAQRRSGKAETMIMTRLKGGATLPSAPMHGRKLSILVTGLVWAAWVVLASSFLLAGKGHVAFAKADPPKNEKEETYVHPRDRGEVGVYMPPCMETEIVCPCADLSKKCPEWARAGECDSSWDYMSINCALSCDLCSSRKKDNYYHLGAEQQTVFEGELFVDETILAEAEKERAASENIGDGGQMINESRNRSPEYLRQRTLQVLSAMDTYIKSIGRPNACKNKHPYCALWASRGFCETRRLSMSATCAPVCHMCHLYTDSGDGNVQRPRQLLEQGLNVEGPEPSRIIMTPFRRLDLVGVFEAMEEDRVVIPKVAYQHGDKASAGGMSLKTAKDGVFSLPLGQIKTFVYRLKPGSESAKAATRERKKWHRRNDDASADASGDGDYLGPYVVQFDRFLSPEECKALLNLIRGAMVGRKDQLVNIQIGQDGFAPPTTDSTVLQNGTLHVRRKSSRTYFNPVSSSSSTGQTGQQDVSRNHPLLESLLRKVEMVTGVPAQTHVEMPVQYDKFAAGHFQEATSHFMDTRSDTILTAVVGGDQDSGGASEGGKMNQNAGDASKASSDASEMSGRRGESVNGKAAPRAMHNARVFGMTIFLSDVESGGEVLLPNMGNFTVGPLMGRAILYPCVMSLVGDSLDNDNASGDGYLFEDTSTILKHNPVRKGIKYTMNLYLRRFAYKK